jgi:hypothetical protein
MGIIVNTGIYPPWIQFDGDPKKPGIYRESKKLIFPNITLLSYIDIFSGVWYSDSHEMESSTLAAEDFSTATIH